MSLKWEHVKEVGPDGKIDFEGDIGTLYCDATGKPLAELLITNPTEEIKQKVIALSPYVPGATSGEHWVNGMLSYGPIDSNSNPTIVENIDVDEDEDGNQILTLTVIKG